MDGAPTRSAGPDRLASVPAWFWATLGVMTAGLVMTAFVAVTAVEDQRTDGVPHDVPGRTYPVTVPDDYYQPDVPDIRVPDIRVPDLGG